MIKLSASFSTKHWQSESLFFNDMHSHPPVNKSHLDGEDEKRNYERCNRREEANCAIGENVHHVVVNIEEIGMEWNLIK